MIRAYSLEHSINIGKQNIILEVLKEYRAVAIKVSNMQWSEFFKSFKFNKMLSIKILESKLSERYKQTLQYQVVGQLESYIANRQNDFVDIVLNSFLDDNTRKNLLYINKSKAWFLKEFKEFDTETLKLAKNIIKRTFKVNRKPNLRYCNMALDNKVAKIEKSNSGKFDYWITLSTLEKGKTLKLPISSNEYFENKEGILKKFVQVNFNREKEIKITLLKNLKKREYIPETSKIALDLGLNNLFASNNGDIFGRGFSKIIKKYDKYITELAKHRQKQKLKTASNRYKNLINNLKNYLKK